jgi:hypothetical protein
MVAAAGVGALVAAHSAARDAPSVGASSRSPSPQPKSGHAERWQGVMVSRTSRGYRSGGTCTTDWRATLSLRIDDGGSISGSGAAKLTSGPTCPFVTGQQQLHRFDLELGGAAEGHRLSVRVTAHPHGNGIDYGGFDEAFQGGRTLILDASSRSATGRRVVRVVPADPTDTAIARTSLRLSTAKAPA